MDKDFADNLTQMADRLKTMSAKLEEDLKNQPKPKDREEMWEWSKVDRSKWGRGPWDNEPDDRVEFVVGGYQCLMLRNRVGAWCGYVGLPKDHPYYGKTYNELWDEGKHITVHGGLTYSRECGGTICHIAAEGQDDTLWWLGFDTAHSGDLVPGIAGHRWNEGGVLSGFRDNATYDPATGIETHDYGHGRAHRDIYKTQATVKAWVCFLAGQLAAAAMK